MPAISENKRKLRRILKKEVLKTDPLGTIGNEVLDHSDTLENIESSLKEVTPRLDQIKGPTQRIADFLNSMKGDKGDTPVYKKDYLTDPEITDIKKEITPVKGQDYYTEEEAQDFLKAATPVKGKDYFDGKDGEPGYTPIKGKDYFDGAKGDQGIPGISTKGDPGKDGVTTTPKDVIVAIKNLKGNDRLDIFNLRNGEQLAGLLGKVNKGKTDFNDQRWHGGGLVTIQNAGVEVSHAATALNFTGSAVNTITSLNGVVTINLTGGTGTVTSISVVTANGISGSVANPTTTPAITLTLGAITPSAIQVSGLTASQILSTDAAKNLTSLDTATYPSLTELSYVKGVTSAIQTQINTKGSGTVTTVSVATANGFAGTVANATTTPSITLITSINSPVLAGNGTAISAATTTGTGSTVVLAAGPTMTNPIVGTQTSTDNSTLAASTAFVTTAVNNAIAAVNPAETVDVASAAKLPNSPTYNNGVAGVGAFITTLTTNTALVVDGYTPTLLDRVLVKNEGDAGGLGAAKNGVYYVSQLAALGVAWILTRALNYDQPSDINSTGAVPVENNGAVNPLTSWLLTTKVTTIGTDAITYTQFSYSPTSVVTPQLGGTGIANNSAMTVTGSGNYGFTRTLTGITNSTFPVGTDTLAGLGTAQTFTATNTHKAIVYTNNAITASGNAATVPITYRLSTVTNNSAATLTITITTASAVDGQPLIVRILDFSGVAQTITWVNTENSTATAPTTSNGSTTLPLTVGFMYNSATSKWRCVASA